MTPNIITVQLNNKSDLVALIDSDDVDLIFNKSWYAVESKGNFYAKTGKNTRMHRIILGVKDTNLIVDHINGNGLDNRKENLRIVDVATNVANRQRSRIGNKCPGVYKCGKKWIAKVTVNYKKHHLGYFDDENDAIHVVNQFRVKIGRPAVLMYPLRQASSGG
jgi:hypothetical protein